MIREAKVNIEDLGVDDARILRDLVSDARKISSSTPINVAARDVAEIEIDINAPEGAVKLSFDASDVPNEVAPLVAFMKKRAKPARAD